MKLIKKDTVRIYTDGACSGNPGPGGWGAILYCNDQKKEMCGGENNTTNNRMELMAAIEALEYLQNPAEVILYTDSIYLRDGITKWINNWKLNNWKTASKRPVKNSELWQRLDKATIPHQIDWKWIKGHSGHPENERADVLARQGLEHI